ncbi:MAG: hypothetical protein MI975_26945 [Cytophagales bacterium]|nr:hypothetical protein [Cytophagales bacterium]
MTLCLAWKNRNEIYFASDSRLTDGNHGIVTDNATKVFKVDVEIYGARDSSNPDAGEPLIHQTKYGICFSGSYLNGSLLADSIEEILSNIQISPYSDYSIDNLSDIAFAIYKQVSKQITEINGSLGLSEVLFGGYCLMNKDFHLYKFAPLPIQQNTLIDFEKSKIDLTKQTILLGDEKAKAAAKKLLFKINSSYSHFHLLREIIRDDSIQTVGGNIQSGIFYPSIFKTYGIVEYTSEEDEWGFLQVRDNYRFRGLKLDFNDSELRKGNLNIHKTFFNPFEDERDKLFKQVSESLEKKIKGTGKRE